MFMLGVDKWVRPVKKKSCVVRSQMNTENAPKVTQTMAKSVVTPKPELSPPEFPLPVPVAVLVRDDDPLVVGFGVGTVPV